MAVKSQVMGPLGGQLDLHLHGYALEAIKFFAKELKIDRFKTNLTLRLHHKFVMTSDNEGLIEPTGDRSFNIDVCLYGNWLGTLAHEMVHMKQYLRGEVDWQLSQWKGKSGYEDVGYWDQPWEIEARKLQNKLMLKFVEAS